MQDIAPPLKQAQIRRQDHPNVVAQELLRIVLRAYALKAPGTIELIYAGTNQVYRLNLTTSQPHQQFAIKLAKLTGEIGIDEKKTEAAILVQLYPFFPHIPQLLKPLKDTPQTMHFPWGLNWRNEYLITVYPWLPHQPYRGLPAQLKHAGARIAQLQQGLAEINITTPRINFIAKRILATQNQGIQSLLSDDFRFAHFHAFITRHAEKSKPCAVLKHHLAFLEEELNTLRLISVGNNPSLGVQKLSLIHQELSPSNFGFNADHSVAAVFDFESLSIGHPLQDSAWAAATFCVDYRKSIAPAIDDLNLLLTAMRAQLNTFPDWRAIFVPFMCLGYLEAIHRKLRQAYQGVDMRMGFVREDILCLRWLRQHNGRLQSAIARL